MTTIAEYCVAIRIEPRYAVASNNRGAARGDFDHAIATIPRRSGWLPSMQQPIATGVLPDSVVLRSRLAGQLCPHQIAAGAIDIGTTLAIPSKLLMLALGHIHDHPREQIEARLD